MSTQFKVGDKDPRGRVLKGWAIKRQRDGLWWSSHYGWGSALLRTIYSDGEYSTKAEPRVRIWAKGPQVAAARRLAREVLASEATRPQSAAEQRAKLGWKPLTDEQREENLAAMGIGSGESGVDTHSTAKNSGEVPPEAPQKGPVVDKPVCDINYPLDMLATSLQTLDETVTAAIYRLQERIAVKREAVYQRGRADERRACVERVRALSCSRGLHDDAQKAVRLAADILEEEAQKAEGEGDG